MAIIPWNRGKNVCSEDWRSLLGTFTSNFWKEVDELIVSLDEVSNELLTEETLLDELFLDLELLTELKFSTILLLGKSFERHSG